MFVPMQRACSAVQNRFLQAVVNHMGAKPHEIFATVVTRRAVHPLTWSDMERDCRRFGRLYASHGLRRGDQVLIFMEFGPALYGAFLGAMLQGIVPSFMPTLTARQNPAIFWSSHAELLGKLNPAGIVCSAAVRAEMQEAGLPIGATQAVDCDNLPEPFEGDFAIGADDAIALLQHSSGTTGLKKGVALTYHAITSQLDNYLQVLDVQDDTQVVSWLPLYHDMGLIACFLLPLYRGLHVHHIDPLHWISRPTLLFDALNGRRGALTWMPNFAFEHLAATVRRDLQRYDLSGVKAFINCSEPCKPQSFDRFAAAFAPAGVRPDQLQCCYAMAETTFAAAQTQLGTPPARLAVDPERLGIGQRPIDPNGSLTVIESGPALPGIDIELYDAERRKLPDGTVGEIGLSGEFLFQDYNMEPQRTRERMQDGVYFSNDLGFRHNGRIFVLGRQDDVIIINGRNLFAHEIEAALARIPGIRPGRLVAVPLQNERTASADLVILAERDPATDRTDGAIRNDVIMITYSTFAVHPRIVALHSPGDLVKTTSGKISRKLNLERYVTAQQRNDVQSLTTSIS